MEVSAGESWLWQRGCAALRGEGFVGPQQRPGRAGKGWVMAVLLLERWIEVGGVSLVGIPASMGEQGDHDFFSNLKKFLRGQGAFLFCSLG